jgi:hypothetical protein
MHLQRRGLWHFPLLDLYPGSHQDIGIETRSGTVGKGLFDADILQPRIQGRSLVTNQE